MTNDERLEIMSNHMKQFLDNLDVNLDVLGIASGKVLIKKITSNNIFEVIKIAPNANYEGLKTKIEIGDIVITTDYIYCNLKLKGDFYSLIKPSAISAYIKAADMPKFEYEITR